MDDIPFHATHWLNTDRPLTLEDFPSRVLAVEVFQMLCPGCVLNGLPQAQRLAQTFDEKDLAVIGLHSVFEHHQGNSRESLAAFLHEWRIPFPVAIDMQGEGPLPRTMGGPGACKAHRASSSSTARAGCGRAISGRSRTWRLVPR